MKFHFLYHASFEGPGSIAFWIKKHGHYMKETNLWAHQSLPFVQDFHALVIMGGPMNIYEDRKYLWLKEEKKFIEKALRCKKKVLGICLGAQLIADVLGAKVSKNKSPEIGWLPVEWTYQAHSVPWLKAYPREFTVFQWHGDTFQIPRSAVRLAKSKACENQAFLYHNQALALQFHLESTPESVALLNKHCGPEKITGNLSQFDKINHKMAELLDGFLKERK